VALPISLPVTQVGKFLFIGNYSGLTLYYRDIIQVYDLPWPEYFKYNLDYMNRLYFHTHVRVYEEVN
jgi:hypothetical protein